MADLKFEFNQAELNHLINSTAQGNEIHIAVYAVREPTKLKGTMYLIAQSFDPNSGAPDTVFRPAVGCPVPPGWKTEDTFLNFSHEDLIKCPKFKVTAAEKAVLTNNQFPANNPLLTVILVGDDASGSLIVQAHCEVRDNKGTLIATIIGDLK